MSTIVLASEFASPCAFCTSEVIDRQIFYQGREALGITTHKPAVPGHVLIIPTRHVERFEDLTPSEVLEMGETIKKVDAAVRRIYGTTGYLLVQKNGREAGQTVPHVHFHYLPCQKGGSQVLLAIKFFLSPWLPARSAEEMAPVIADLRLELSRQ
jgi:diadenosine tetraphosphate (Ap4A) HIT family hydrolase